MKLRFRIKRYDPQLDAAPHWADYEVECEPTDRVLDGLNYIKWHLDGSLTYRRSCAHGVCGSDAMMINGRNRLACKVLVKEVGGSVTIEPLRGFRVLRDLAVDLDRFFEAYRAQKPYLINDEPVPHGERLQSPAERLRFDDTTKCILCACCTGACPPYWANHEFVGPAAIVNAHRFIFDSRDRATEERLDILNQRDGVWRCRTVFNCTDACPRDIEVTKAIEEVKRAILMRGDG
jgi:succinate dehydrogenase / fumarate reductase iron-sulfur subunit